MKLLVAGTIIFAIAVLPGCGKKDEFGTSARLPLEAVVLKEDGKKLSRNLAYEHRIDLDVPEEQVAQVFEAGQAACREASADLCVVLESSLTGRSGSYASLKLRATAGGVRKLVASLSQHGQVVSQSTTAEDITSSMEDATKKLAMLHDYRSKLEALRTRASNNVDSLIKVNRELAQVQSDLEDATGVHAHLKQRIDTEILHVSISSVRSQSFWKPIGIAIKDFSMNLSQGVSSAIVGLAFLIPWALLIAVVGWVCRKLWVKSKR